MWGLEFSAKCARIVALPFPSSSLSFSHEHNMVEHCRLCCAHTLSDARISVHDNVASAYFVWNISSLETQPAFKTRSEGPGPQHWRRPRGLTACLDLQAAIPNAQTMRHNRWWVEARCKSERLLFRGSQPIDCHRVASVPPGMLRTPVSLMSTDSETVSLRLVTVTVA